ncbi:hypothetical protein ACFVDI_05735 [Nocardioides sp. NPDC057767]|uniref:hypothetical protein n=1 Tax=unclassified Nocardioides TaxID=2615069 RepID=UPI00366FBA01
MTSEPVQPASDQEYRYRLTLHAGEQSYVADGGRRQYAALAKIVRSDGDTVFLICGQDASTNRAACRYLATTYRDLIKTYGLRGHFCLVLEATEPAALGLDLIAVVADVTDTAFKTPHESSELPESDRPIGA